MPKKTNQKKTTRKGRARAKKAKPPFSFKRGLWAITLICLLVAAGAVLSRFLIPRISPPMEAPKPIPAVEPAVPYEIFPKEKPVQIIPPVEPVQPIPKPRVPAPEKLPKVAIIIDDMGYDRQMAKKFIELDAVITYAILPFSPHQRELSAAAQQKGLETMLHLPMEPTEYPTIKPGPGALLTTMTPDELLHQLKKDLQSVPGARGVNNHMGSRMTEVSVQLYQIFSLLKKEGLFFIDSRTTPASLCRPSARLLRLPFAERNVFLDHVQTEESVKKQIRQLVAIALQKGEAVGIGHPHAITYSVLRELLPEIQKKVKLVPASEVVHLAG